LVYLKGFKSERACPSTSGLGDQKGEQVEARQVKSFLE